MAIPARSHGGGQWLFASLASRLIATAALSLSHPTTLTCKSRIVANSPSAPNPRSGRAPSR
ncbi:MAG TPA: hypothetical protein P5534_23245, partial [Candidatus Paceibacterota bacterium]|nr:hypothetical protein [Candidatus Paceibacterota bacterium]